MPRRLRRAHKIAFTAALLGLPVLAAEGWLRLRAPHSDLWVLTGRSRGPDIKAAWADVDAFCAYRARPGTYTGVGADGTKVKTVNSDGFISTPELTVARRPDTLRIAFLGESSCAGTGSEPVLADEETWPWQVTRDLQHVLGREVELLNGAASAYTSLESLGRFAGRVRFYRPDVLVIYHGWNDLIFAHPDVDFARWRTHTDGSWSLTRQFALLEPRALDHLIWPSQLLTKLRIRVDKLPTGQLPEELREVPEIDLQRLEVARENLRLILALARSLGIETFVCLQPTLVAPELDPADRARCYYLPFPHEAHLRAIAAYRAMQRQEVPAGRLIDLTALDGQGPLFMDHIHPSPSGATEIAEVVTRALLEESSVIREVPRAGGS